LLDKLIRDIVIETKTIDIEAIIPLLKAQITRTKPYIRQLVVGWIMVLKAVPNIHLLDFLPDFLGGLFDMLGDPAQEIREAASNALSAFLHDIRCDCNSV
jgi:vacuole morphology and inheritance protein 14